MMHHKHVDNFRTWYYDHAYAIFRVMIGLLFMQHGLQKLFGFFGGNVADPFTKMWYAGMVELVGGLLVAIGLLTSLAAALSAIQMAVAFFMAHFSFANWVPIVNKGELALVFFAAFLFIAVHGPGRYSVDAKSCKKCLKNHK